MQDSTPQQPAHLSLQPQNGFLILLLSLLALQIIPPLINQSERSILLGILVSIVLLFALYLVAYSRKELIIGMLLCAPAIATNWTSNSVDATLVIYAHYFFAIAFLAYICVHIFRYLFESEDISADMLYAAVCLYFIVGMIWAMVYVLIEMYHPGSFQLDSDLDNTRAVFGELLYFSYVTITTLGYGDMAPLTRLARSWVTIEAIIGQFYLAFVVARLVSLQVTNRKNPSA
jgi:voltage-gated potassium channel